MKGFNPNPSDPVQVSVPRWIYEQIAGLRLRMIAPVVFGQIAKISLRIARSSGVVPR